MILIVDDYYLTNMKIQLKNFKCYTDSTFEFGEKGIVLISGPSGVGKTSIISGIQFALYGTGTNLTMHGKSSCEVELTFGNLIIKRMRRPNRLLVNNEHEDEAGQEIINKMFGDMFETCSYISQNPLSTFIMMSPIEKLIFLEKIAFQEINLGLIKTRCKSLTKETNDSLVGAKSQIDMTKNILSTLTEPLKMVYPLKGLLKQREQLEKNENIQYKNCNIMLKKYRKKLVDIQSELNCVKLLLVSCETKKEELVKIKEKNNNLITTKDQIIYEGDDNLSMYQERLNVLLSSKELLQLELQYKESVQRLEEMKNKEMERNERKLETINKELWVEFSKEEFKTTITDTKVYLVDMETIHKQKQEQKRYKINTEEIKENKLTCEHLKEQLDKKKDLVSKLKLEQELYECPSCDAKLHLFDNKLCVFETTLSPCEDGDIKELENEIIEIANKIRKLDRIIPEQENKQENFEKISKVISQLESQYEELMSVADIKEDLEYLQKYKSTQCELEIKRNEMMNFITNKIFSIAINTFENENIKQSKRIKDIKSKINLKSESMDEEQLRTKIEQEKKNKTCLEKLESELKCLKEERMRYEEYIKCEYEKHDKKYVVVNCTVKLEEDIKETETKIINTEDKRELHNTNLRKIEKYKEYEKELDNYNNWKEKLKEVSKTEEAAKVRYAASIILKEKILEAESIAMFNIIESINLHTQVFLDDFFPDNPIVVRLLPFKEMKKVTKPQINIEVEYKGMECGISSLSGGELSRVILAFTLALTEMFNIPLIMLDECTSSLDQELNGVVVNSIKKYFYNKTVLVISHQSLAGIYDKVIELK
jgi:exonuclease SbcC